MNIGHVDILLSQFTIFCAVRNKEWNGDGIVHIVARIQPELSVKCPRESIHIGKPGIVGRVDDLDLSAAKQLCRLREPVFADIFRRRQSEAFSEQPVGIPRGEQRNTSQIGEADFSCLVFAM